MKRAGLIMAMAGAAAFLLMPPPVPPEDAEDEPDYTPPDLIDAANSLAQEVIEMTTTESDEVREKNLQAFLWMIRVSEGTSGPNGYSTLVGGRQFVGFTDHPRILVDLPNLGIKSSAAGAYQIIRRTWDSVRGKLGLADFSPASQDAAAIELIRQRGALADVRAGNFAAALDKCKKEWASLPGAGYGQHENSFARLQQAYITAGGYIA